MKSVDKNVEDSINSHTETQYEKLWSDSVIQFKELIESDPILRMNWQHGISISTNLKDKTVDDVYSMIDKAIREPPSYKNSIFVGIPIFFIIMDFMQNQNGRAFFTNQKVNLALKKIFGDYAKMLESPESTKYMNKVQGTGWFSQVAENRVNNWQFKCNPQIEHFGYKCWNDWFTREFKDGMRPVGDGAPPGIEASNMIVNACESIPLDDPVQPQRNCKLTDKFWLKNNRYSLTDIFGGKKHKKQHFAKHFEGGTIYQAHLSVHCYHRWHTPIDGTIEDIYQIDANYYFDQSQFIDYYPMSQMKCQSFLTAVATRKIFIINLDNDNIGKVVLVCVGMAEVSCCVSTVSIGNRVKKGDQLGYFKFGGSSHAIIFEKKAKLKFKVEGLLAAKLSGTNPAIQKVNSYLAHVE